MAEPTLHDALVAEMLGDIGKLHEAVALLTEAVNNNATTIQAIIAQLEGAGESYNQAVLAANLKSKNDMLRYVETMTQLNVAKVKEEQQALVQGIIRETVSGEVIALKKALSQANKIQRAPFRDRLVYGFACSLFAAMVGSVITFEFLKRWFSF